MVAKAVDRCAMHKQTHFYSYKTTESVTAPDDCTLDKGFPGTRIFWLKIYTKYRGYFFTPIFFTPFLNHFFTPIFLHHFFTPIFYTNFFTPIFLHNFFTPIFFTPFFTPIFLHHFLHLFLHQFLLHQNFCFFYTKIVAFFTPIFFTKIFAFFTPKFLLFLHQNVFYQLQL